MTVFLNRLSPRVLAESPEMLFLPDAVVGFTGTEEMIRFFGEGLLARILSRGIDSGTSHGLQGDPLRGTKTLARALWFKSRARCENRLHHRDLRRWHDFVPRS